jgi:hypothetical protein
MADSRPFIRRVWSGLLASTPGLILLSLYVMRINALRDDPSGSPGTPGETVIALMVAAFTVASLLFARMAYKGHLPRFAKSIGVIALAGGVLGLLCGVVVMA